MIDIEVLTEAYLVMKEYVPARDRQTAADHLIGSLSDMSIDDRDLRKFAAVDTYLKRAIEDFLNDDDEEIEEDDVDDYEDD